MKSKDAATLTDSFFRLASLSKTTDARSSVRKIKSKGAEEYEKIRQARTCYDHLAGVEGVRLMDSLLQMKWLRQTDSSPKVTFQLTSEGEEGLDKLGVIRADARKSRRLFAYGCLDWTERRYHLGGSLGKAILDQMVLVRVVEKTRSAIGGRRALTVRKSTADWMSLPAS